MSSNATGSDGEAPPDRGETAENGDVTVENGDVTAEHGGEPADGAAGTAAAVPTGPSRAIGAVRGAIGFLTRLPVSVDGREWAAFRTTPAAFPVAGWLVGAGAAIPLLAAGRLPDATVAFGFLLAVYLLTGINHLDGVADLGDAVAVHGDAGRRREVLKDTTTGVGAVLAVAVVVAGIGLAGLGLAGIEPDGLGPSGTVLPAAVSVAIAVVIAAEVGAKLGMAAMACLGRASHEGFGSQFTDAAGPASLVAPAAIAAPAAALSWPHPAAAVALVGALAGAAIPWCWARRRLGGVSGDVFGAANEVGRLVGLHAGVIAWTLL